MNYNNYYNANVTEWENYLDFVTSGNVTEKTRFYEIIGYLVSNIYDPYLVLLQGKRRSGKSTFIDLINSFFDPICSSSLYAYQLKKTDAFEKCASVKFFLDPDIGEKAISDKDLSILKKATGNDGVISRSLSKNGISLPFTGKRFIWGTNYFLEAMTGLIWLCRNASGVCVLGRHIQKNHGVILLKWIYNV